MKSFFKKLAFVMALAMVVSMAAPAAVSAVAASDLKVAYQNGSAISEVNLAKVGDVEDLKFTGAPNWKTEGVTWTSENTAVATVDAAGKVTAVAAGTTNVTVKVGDAVATVKVNVVDLPTYTATMGVASNKNMTTLALEKAGDTFDLAFYGIKDYDAKRYQCNWFEAGDGSVATVDNKGLVTAVGEGKTVISLGVYNVITGKKHVVDSCTVTVGASAPVEKKDFAVAQKDADKFVITFDSAKTIAEINEGLEVALKMDGQTYSLGFDNVTVEGNTVTVSTYNQFEDGEVYVLTFDGKKAECTIVLGEIATVGVDYYTGKNTENKYAFVAEEGEESDVTLVPVLFDKYGNDITAKYDLNNNFTFTYEVSDNVEATPQYNDVYTFGKEGVATVNVTAEWWDEETNDTKTATGKTSFVVENRGKIGFTFQKAGIATSLNWVGAWGETTGTDDAFTYSNSTVEDFTIDPNSVLWNEWGGYFVKTSFDYREDRLPYFTAVFKDNRGNLVTSNNDNYPYGEFSYDSTNDDVVSIDSDGKITFVDLGKTNILVYFEPYDGTETKKLIASTTISVTPELVPKTFEIIDGNSKKTAGFVVDEDLNDVTYWVQFKDQFGAVYDQRTGDLSSALEIELVDEDNDTLYTGANDVVTSFEWTAWKNAYKLVIDGSAFDLDDDKSKTYSYKITLDDSDVAETVTTKAQFVKLTVVDTEEERDTIQSFIGGAIDDADYKFSIAFDGNSNVDVAVKNYVNYANTNLQAVQKMNNGDTNVSATYCTNSGGLAIAKVPANKFVEIGTKKTGDAGYVYYKINAPKNETATGVKYNNVKGQNWDAVPALGGINFWFNNTTEATSVTTYTFEDANGTEYTARAKVESDPTTGEGWDAIDLGQLVIPGQYWNFDVQLSDNTKAYEADVTEGTQCKIYPDGNETVITCTAVETDSEEASFKFAGEGSYKVTFSLASKDGANLSTKKTSIINVSNSMSEMKYLGLNPEYKGRTELDLTDVEDIIKEQLRFSYEELFFGEYYGEKDVLNYNYNAWELTGIDNMVKINLAASDIEVKKDRVEINKLAFDIKLDNPDETVMYTVVLNIDATIKEK